MPIEEPSRDPMREVTPLLIEVQSNLDRELSLASLARQYGYSPCHFHRFFSSAVGETPKRHVERLRLERGAYKLAITDETVLDVALSIGFANHETFSRAFRRAFGCSPRDYRRACKAAQDEWSQRKIGFRGEGCSLSELRFVSLPAMTFVAIRHHGAYAELPVPFQDGEPLWNELIDWTRRNKAPCRPLAWLVCYDDPTVTPPALQRVDACISAAGSVRPAGRIRRLDFAGGWYGRIEHVGPLSTIEQAYWAVADGIRRSRRYALAEGPPVQVYRSIHVGGNPAANVSEVYFPVRLAR